MNYNRKENYVFNYSCCGIGCGMKIFLLELPVFLLLSGKGKKAFLIGFCIYLAICSLLLVYQKKKTKISLNIQYPVLTICICLLFSVFFYLRWNTSLRLNFLSEFLQFPTKQTWLLCTSVLALCSTFGIDYLIKQVSVFFRKEKNDSRPCELSKKQIVLIIFLSGLIMITLNSECSPIYPFNDWDDVNTIFTVGKSIIKGYVPYRDLYEQKGPLTYFLQVPAALISYTSFIGLWYIEIICAFFFLYFSYKIAELYVAQKAVFIIPFLSLLTYSSASFHLGGAAEEYCLPLLAYALYIGCKSMEKNQLPSNKEFFLIGITSACVFWIKYSLVGFYLGWFLFFVIIAVKKEQCISLFHGLLFITAGVIFLTMPILIYFIVNKALSYLWQVYFYNNLFLYPNKTNGILSIIHDGFSNFFICNTYCFITILFVLSQFLWCHYKQRFIFFCLTFTGLFFTIYSGGRFHTYYSLIFNIYAVFGLSCLALFVSYLPQLETKITAFKDSFVAVLFYACAVWMCMISLNMFYLRHEKEDLMQYKMASILEEKGTESPTVVTWDYGETGVNTVMGLIPDIRYFCFYANAKNTENRDVLKKCFEEQCADVILINNAHEDSYPEFENYEHMGTIEGTFNRSYRYYHYYMPEGKFDQL